MHNREKAKMPKKELPVMTRQGFLAKLLSTYSLMITTCGLKTDRNICPPQEASRLYDRIEGMLCKFHE